MRKISISDWELFSERRNSKNYFNKDKTLILKTSSENRTFTSSELENEMQLSKNVSELGIKTPKVFEVVELDCGGYASISEYIPNKKSISRAISDDFSNAEIYIQKFVNIVKELHNTKCDKTKFCSIEEKMEIIMAKRHEFYTEEIKNKIINAMQKIEKRDTCLHMDCQFSNVISSDKGEYFIDLSDFCYGNPYYDTAILFFFSSNYFAPPKLHENLFHLNDEQFKICWRIFLKLYYGITDENEIIKFEKNIMPYALISFMCVTGEHELSNLVISNMEKYKNKIFD